MFEHDQIIYAIEQKYSLQHGRDFVVGHPLGDDGKQSGEAYIMRWLSTQTPPSMLWMRELFASTYSDGFDAMMARETRDLILSKSDWTQNADVDPALKAKYVPYRQLLRDISSQEGFPKLIVWPIEPK